MPWGGSAVRWGSGPCGTWRLPLPSVQCRGERGASVLGLPLAADRVVCSQPPKATGKERGSQRPLKDAVLVDQLPVTGAAPERRPCSGRPVLSSCPSVCRWELSGRRGAPAPAASPLVGPLWLSGAWGSGRGTGCWWRWQLRSAPSCPHFHHSLGLSRGVSSPCRSRRELATTVTRGLPFQRLHLP